MIRGLWLVVFLLAGCSGTMMGGYQAYLAKKGVTDAVTIEKFPHCHGYGCRHVVNVKLSKRDWRAIEKPLRSIHSAAEEREGIKRSIAEFEKRVGDLTGTEQDRGGTYVDVGTMQHDCVDESVNTTIYLALLTQKKRLKFHEVGTPTARTIFTSGALGPHQTAVIAETKTGARFAVDSWFHDNGVMPEIVPLNEWIGGWRP
ncbi:MAG: hypothetical protein KKA05_01175 [Alphaproteobacteria bacterium]|nr:hypothetical protein [Alphaproteobacteria bacterium]MBU0858780.1 hypothetical protein [Alphaproteobacteria bacterium]